MNWVIKKLFPSKPIHTELDINKLCSLCVEPGAKTRPCCRQLYCDHCYTKNRQCPYCETPTRQEKMTGATYVVKAFSEHEECRTCLDPGIKRRCCGQYYCDECYYKLPLCRSCESPVGKRGNFSEAAIAEFFSVVLGWWITIFICASIAAVIVVVLNSELQTPIGIYGNKCHGFFRKCDYYFCDEQPDSVATAIDAITPLTTWKHCDNSSTSKIQGWGCIFDQQLFDLTGSDRGYEYCKSEFWDGIYIFEDTFDSWDNFTVNSNKMKSGKWLNINNGRSTPYCGSYIENASFPTNYYNGPNALQFSGDNSRLAESIDLDLSSGGWLEARYFVAPISFDTSNPNCKSAYGGVLYAEWSTDYGATWNKMGVYSSWTYRTSSWEFIKAEFPPESWTSHTRFRYEQRNFESTRDHFALDNIKVLRYLPKKWYNLENFMYNMEKIVQPRLQKLQCCFDTDWCTRRFSPEYMSSTCKEFKWYHGNFFLLRSAELYILIVVIINVFKQVYCAVQHYLMHNRLPFEDEYDDLMKFDRLLKLIPPKWRPRKRLEDFAKNVHSSARLVAELKDQFDDGEAMGDFKKRKELLKKEREAEKKRVKKLKKKLAKRQSKKNFRGTGEDVVVENVIEGSDSDEEKNDENDEEAQIKFGVNNDLADDMDQFKRQNVAMLRVPFDTETSEPWLKMWFYITGFVYTVIVLYKISTTPYFNAYERIEPYGAGYYTYLEFTSFGINLLAMICDFKELYNVWKNTIPSRQEWVPLITIDMSEDINALFIAQHVISLKDISESSTFSPVFVAINAFAYFIGSFPWCVISILVRNENMSFGTMRILSPALLIVMVSRAVLGPGFVIKVAFSLYYMFATNYKVREAIGVTLQDNRTWYSMTNTGLSFLFIALVFGSTFAYEYYPYICAGAFVLGLFYGTLTGCIHGLPIKPWMYLTTIRQGVWLRVKKKQKCPCIYWGAYCTEMHDADEVFIIFPTEETKFLNMVKGTNNVTED